MVVLPWDLTEVSSVSGAVCLVQFQGLVYSASGLQ